MDIFFSSIFPLSITIVLPSDWPSGKPSAEIISSSQPSSDGKCQGKTDDNCEGKPDGASSKGMVDACFEGVLLGPSDGSKEGRITGCRLGVVVNGRSFAGSTRDGTTETDNFCEGTWEVIMERLDEGPADGLVDVSSIG